MTATGAGRVEETVEWLSQAVAAAPADRALHANLGLALARLGRTGEAVEAYRRSLALEPGHAATLAKLGRALTHLEQFDEAVAVLGQAATLEPGNADTANALGAALAALPDEATAAQAAFERAVALDGNFGEAWRNLGLLAARSERWAAAAAAFERAIALEPPDATLWYRYGVALSRSPARAGAVDAYRHAVELDPRYAAAWNNLAHEWAARGERRQALDAVSTALRLEPNYVAARYNLGVTLQSLGRLDDARRAYQLVLAAHGAHADALNNLGGVCLSEARPAQAARLYESALAAAPEHPEARWNLGLAELSLGRWQAGWRNYEARTQPRAIDTIRRWRRAAPLSGSHLLLWCEQGLGDGVQFLRYAAVMRALGAARLTVECPARLAPLVRLAEGIDGVVERGAPLPAADYQISLMSLPAELETCEETIPEPAPRYRLPEARRAAWRQRLDESDRRARLRAGIVWGGNPNHPQGLVRSMPLEALAPLATLPGVQLISLQHGPQVSELGPVDGVVHWEQQDLVDTASLAAECDLVLTVDTLMAHLAGTLGCRTWVMLPFAADWRWMTAPRRDSPWYPGMRLFRQTAAGDWASVVRQLADELPQIQPCQR